MAEALSHVEALLQEAGWIRALAGRLVHDHAGADDLAQETITAALRSPPPGDRPLRPWLVRVMRNLSARGALRERARAGRERDAAAREALPSSSELAERADVQRQVVEAVLALREPYRSVVLLRYYEGLSAEAIAARRGLPSGTVRSQLSRALDELRERLDRRHGARRAWVALLAPLASDSDDSGGHGGGASVGGAAQALSTISGVPSLAAGILCCAVALAAAAWMWLADRAPRGTGARGELALARAAEAPAASDGAASEARAPAALASGTAGGPASEPPALDAPIRGRVLERASLEPVPSYALTVHAAGAPAEPLLTGLDGRFASARSYAAGEVEIALHDHPELRAARTLTLTHDPESSAEHELLTSTGPTYFLDLAPAEPGIPPGLCFVLLNRSTTYTIHGRHPLGPEPSPVRLPMNAQDAHAAADTDPLLAKPWVRLQPDALRFLGIGPWNLQVVSGDGMVGGRGFVESCEGVVRKPVLVKLGLTGVIAGTLRRADGRVAMRPWIRLLSADGGKVCGLKPGAIMAQPEPDGSYLLRGILQGDYVVAGSADGCVEARAEVTVVAGERASVDFALEAVGPPAGAVHARVESQSGSWEGTLDFRLLSREIPGLVLSAPLVWTGAPNARIARASIEDVPAGEYDAVVAGATHLYFDLPDGPVRPGGAELVATCMDLEAHRDVSVIARDAETGSVLPLVDLLYICGNERPPGAPVLLPSKHDSRPGEVALDDVPLTLPITWSVRADGYVPAYGTETDLREEGGVAWIDVRLARGWGARVVARDSRFERIAGAEVLVDDALYGTTGDDGTLCLELAARPSTIRVRHLDWSPALEEFSDGRTGQFRDQQWSELVYTLIEP